jgi:Tol biopolymer transport system component
MRKALAVAGLSIGLGLAGAASASAAWDYTQPFSLKTHTPAFGQAPVFLPDGRVLFGQDFKQGQKNQVYIENYDGTGQKCLTCTDVPDPGNGNVSGSDPNNVNGVPAVRPQGDWVIFHSWRGHGMVIGSPGYGGMGSSLWAMHPDGSDQTRLTETGESNFSGEGYDDYHAYWSPDGTHIEYAHLNWNFVTGGGSGKWDVRVAKFNVGADGKPYLSDDHEVRPYNGHWYETQWWNPNPSTPGFLYTESYPEQASGGGASVPQLFYCALPSLDSGQCQVTRITDHASWDEQAIFTPDGQKVLFMSSRDRDGIFNTWANLTRSAGVPSDLDYLLILPIFEAGFLQPVGQEATDLYMTSLSDPQAVTRLTTDGDDGWITPEFGWDPSGQCLVWTENRFPDGYRYQLPQGPSGWLAQLQFLATNPPDPNKIVDVNQNGVGVAPLPVEQRTRIGSFAGSTCTL